MLSEKQKAKLNSSSKAERYTMLGLADVYNANKAVIKTYRKLNEKQVSMFKTFLHGYNGISKTKLNALPLKSQYKIRKRWKLSQKAINKFKEEVCFNMCNEFFLNVFKGTNFKKLGNKLSFLWTTPITSEDANDTQMIRFMTLKEIGLDYDDLILKLIQQKILPSNFYSL